MSNVKRNLVKMLVILLLLSTVLSVNIAVQAEGVPADGLVAHYKFDGDIKDASGLGNDGTAIGSFTYKDAVIGKGAIFNGESYIEVEDNDLLDLMNGYTISAWIYKDSKGESEDQPIVRKTGNSMQEDWPSYEFANRDFQSTGFVYTEDENYDSIYSKGRVDYQKWALVTVSYDNDSVKLYINGVLNTNQRVPGSIPESSGPLQIGFGDYGDSSFFKGVMDDLRIYNRILSTDEVKTLYNAGVTGTGKDLVVMPKRLAALYSFNGNTEDSSGLGNHGSIVGNISYTDAKSGKGAKFDGSSYIEVKDNDVLDLTEGYTFSLWVYKEDASEIQEQPILMKNGCSYDEENESYIFGINDSEPYIQIFSEYGNYDRLMPDFLLENNKWYMLSVTYDGKEAKYYRDGTLIANEAGKGSVPASSGKLYIGHNEFDGSSFYKGIMDELRIYNYALNANEVKALYSPAPTVPTVPTVPTAPTTPSTDTPSKWFVPEIEKAIELNLVTDKVLSRYQTNITREEFCELAVLLYEALSGKKAETAVVNPFTDTINPEILKANNLNIAGGKGAGTFAPNQFVTRQEICVMLTNTIKAAKPGIDTAVTGTVTFGDEGNIANWAKDAVKFLNKNEIMKGTGTTVVSITPKGNTSREQAIAMVKRTFEQFSKYQWLARPEGGGEWRVAP